MIPAFLKNRRTLFLLTGCVSTTVVLTFLLWPARHVPEPQYQGKLFSEWFDVYCQSGRRAGMPGRAEAVHAIQEMGTNSLPFLFHVMQHETPAWKTTLRKIAPKLPAATRGSGVFKHLLDDPAARRADSLSTAFAILGSQAAPAGPELIKLLNDKKHPQTAKRAWICAAIVGQSLTSQDTPNGVPGSRFLPIAHSPFHESGIILLQNGLRNAQTNRTAGRNQNPFDF